MIESRFRTNHELYAKIRKIRHEEKTQIFEDSTDRIGVRIDWTQFGKILEAKTRKELGDEYILDSKPIEIKREKSKFSFGECLVEIALGFNGVFSSIN